MKESLEILEQKSKVTLILGPLGSGKTSLIKRLLPHYPKDTILIINDVGAINIDSKRIKGNEIIALKEGCVCCEDINSLKDTLIQLKGKAKNIIIEPSGIAEGTSIKKILNELGFDTSTIFLGDIEHHESRSEIEKEIIKNQIKVSDIVGLTWLSLDTKKIDDFHNWLKYIKPNIETIEIPKVDDNQEYSTQIEDKFELIVNKIQNIGEKTKKDISKIFSWGIRLEQNSNQSPVFTLSKELNIKRKTLEFILQNNPDIIRAKGLVENREFDYVRPDLNFGKYTKEKPYITFISTKQIDFSLEEEDEFNFLNDKNNTDMLDFELSKEKIDILVAQYHEYMDLERQINDLKERLKDTEDIKIIQNITLLQLKQKYLGESMKYDNPFIWLEYKRLAYAGTRSKVENIKELKKHCESPTYICHKRLDFLNEILKTYYNIDIFDDKLDGNMTLLNFLENGVIEDISKKSEFMDKWLKYEYFEIENRVSKWENYIK